MILLLAALMMPLSALYSLPAEAGGAVSETFPERRGHQSVVLDDEIILIGGFINADSFGDVWKSEDGGETWTELNDDPGWPARGWHTAVVLPDESIVIMGGNHNTEELLNDIWRSTDGGENWTEVTTNAPWSAREDHTSVVLSDGSIVLMGGNDGDADWDGGSYTNDVWRSTDGGASWIEMTANAPWSPRAGLRAVALSNDDIVMMGGYIDDEVYNDVWLSTDQGTTWTEVRAEADWEKRGSFDLVTLANDDIILTGGLYWNDDWKSFSDVWRSADGGASWNLVNDNPGWRDRYGHSCVVLSDESIVLTGGRTATGWWMHMNDVWASTDQGVSWNHLSGDPWPPSFTVDPTTDTIAVHLWPPNTELDVEVFDPNDPDTKWEGSITTDHNGDYWLYIGDEYNIDTGHFVYVTDDETVKWHIVTALRISEFDWQNNMIAGVAEAGTDVEVVIYAEPEVIRHVTAVDGTWQVDFSEAVGSEPWQRAYNIGPGDHGNANQRDEDGDETHIYWNVAVFPDVNPDHVHFAGIAAVAAEGITTGYADGTFRPSQAVTRAEMATFLFRALNLTDPGTRGTFPDVTAGSTHEISIEAIAAAGITTGYFDGTFRPSQAVTRAEMATFLFRAFNLADPGTRGTFPDVPAGHVHEVSIEAIAAEGITVGYFDGTFRPSQTVTRAEMATFLARALGLI